MSRHISLCRDIMSIETNELGRNIISLCCDQVRSKLGSGKKVFVTTYSLCHDMSTLEHHMSRHSCSIVIKDRPSF